MPPCTDNDGDIYFVEGGECGPVDCDDGDAAVNPAMTGICGNGIDDDCNSLVDWDDPDCPACPLMRLSHATPGSQEFVRQAPEHARSIGPGMNVDWVLIHASRIGAGVNAYLITDR